MYFGFSKNYLVSLASSGKKHCPSHLTTLGQCFFQDLERVFNNEEKHMTTVRSEAERVIDHNLSVCHSLTEVMGVQHNRPYEALLLGSHPSLVVFKAALYTNVPRSPFFAFCTPKYCRLQKCG